MKFLSPLLITILFGVACSKKDTPDVPQNNNEFHAQLIFSPDSSQRIDVTGTKAGMGCSWGTTFVSGLREDDAYVGLQVFFGELKCVTSPGIYTSEVLCEYRPNLYYGNIYGSNSANPARLVFTTVTADYMEGSFECVCFASVTDSVIVTGTFKGANL